MLAEFLGVRPERPTVPLPHRGEDLAHERGFADDEAETSRRLGQAVQYLWRQTMARRPGVRGSG